MNAAARHHPHLLRPLQPPVLNSHQDHHAEILVIPTVHHERLQRRIPIPPRRRQPGDQRLQHALDVHPGLGADHHRVGRIQTDHVLDLLLHPVRLGSRQVDLVEHRHDLVLRLDGLIDVGQRLRLHPLGRVHHQQRPLAGGQRTGHLVGEVHVPRRVHQVQDVDLPVLGRIRQAHGLRLDGDAPLLLQLHVVQDLLGHLPRGQPSRGLDQPVGQRGLAVVDMGDDGEVTDVVDAGFGHGAPGV